MTLSYQHQLTIEQMKLGWNSDKGIFACMDIPSAMFWLDPSLLHMLQPLAREMGIPLFRLHVAWSSSMGTKEDYHAMVTVFSDSFADGFLAWGRAVGAAGWGGFELPHFDAETQEATVIVRNTWELLMQRNQTERWGCPFIQGKIIGIFSHAFGTNCWADEVHASYDEDDAYVELKIYPSTRTIESEIKRLRLEQMAQRERELTAMVEAQTKKLQESMRKLQLAQAAAEDASRAKSAFLATMSHELRTPLNAIIGYSEILQEDLEDNESTPSSEDVRRIGTAGRHLLSLIDQVLDLAKIEAGREEVIWDVIQLKRFVDEVEQLARPLAHNNNNTFSAAFPMDAPTLKFDGVKVRQVLLNLLSNACKFTHEGEISLVLRLLPDANEPSILQCLVTDTGIGIAPEQLERIFESFTQVDSSLHRSFGGTGLGLALCRQICDLLDGEIEVQSEPGEGSTFAVTIPVKLA